MPLRSRRAAANSLYLLMIGSVLLVGMLVLLLLAPSFGSRGRATVESGPSESSGAGSSAGDRLFLYCAAGMRYAVDQIVADYKEQYGVEVQPEYQGSNTLLSQLELSQTGDLYLAADETYVQMARERGLVAESIPLARMRPVIVVPRGNPRGIDSIDSLLAGKLRLALGEPGSAAVGKKTHRLLAASGHWPELQRQTRSRGVFKPTVNDVAISVEVGSVDAGIVWDSTAAQYQQLEAIRVPELDRGTANVEIAVVTNSKSPTAALRFARYAAARDRGLKSFAAKGFEVVDGDVWERNPELTFFAGAVNRRALEPVIKQFERREGVRVNTIYNGCGILTAQMRTMRDEQSSGFPDTYMACDVYYLDSVADMFQDAVNVSDTDVVITVAEGNPKGIKSLEDLLRDDVRVVLGDPDRCTIGVLSRRLLQEAGIYQRLMAEKDVVLKASSALLVPDIVTKASDATLAYRTDTRAEGSQVDDVAIGHRFSKAIQPFAVARSSDFKYLSRRLFDTIARSRDAFETAGFNWRLNGTAGQPSSQPPTASD